MSSGYIINEPSGNPEYPFRAILIKRVPVTRYTQMGIEVEEVAEAKTALAANALVRDIARMRRIQLAK